MYHGIVMGCFPVVSLEKKEGLHHCAVDLNAELTEGLKQGASIAIDGVCVTVSKLEDNRVFFDIMDETLNRTTLSTLELGSRVNIERSARTGDEIGGHVLSGHVDGLAQITDIQTPPNNHVIHCSVPDNLTRYIFQKGFLAVNGASLTVVDVDRKGNCFSVHLIPETLRLTTFGTKRVGDFLNIEIERNTQVLVDTVRDFLEQAMHKLASAQKIDSAEAACALIESPNSKLLSFLPRG
jgi:riboflavin synthase